MTAEVVNRNVVTKVKKARGKRLACRSRIILSVSVPSQYLVTLASETPLNDAKITELVSNAATLHAVVLNCKAAHVAVSFSDLGNDGVAQNSWVRAKVVKV